jgi:hypothetical protein
LRRVLLGLGSAIFGSFDVEKVELVNTNKLKVFNQLFNRSFAIM